MSSSVWKNTPSGKTVRRNRKKQTKPFVMLPKYMLTSAAWRSLTAESIAAYVELARRYDGINNGRLHLTAREFAAIRPISRVTASRAIRALVDRGFAEIVRASGFNVKDRKRQGTEYRITIFQCDVTSQPPSKAFMSWQPAENIPRLHNRATSVSSEKPCGKIIQEFASTASLVTP